MPESISQPIVVQMPAGVPAQLVLMFHGVGGQADNLVPLGRRIATALPYAAVLSVPSPDACDLGAGYQWFSVRGVTEENRVGRVAETMPRFLATVRHWQQATGVPVAATALVGFSQGAIMSLAATQQPDAVAACVIGLSGRFANTPTVVHGDQAIHLVHGTADAVMAPAQSVAAAEALTALGAKVSVDLVQGLGHGVNAEVENLVVQRLGDRFL